jgi:GNAT superfamily N-acetyltransferase
VTHPGYELAAYEPAHRQDYLRLLHDAWGDLALTGEEFDWWFRENRAGSLMSIARLNGRVVGVASHSLFRMILSGEEQLASFSVHATTDAAARGRGIFESLERKHEQEAQERGVAVVLAFASKPTAPIFLGPLGWTEIGRLRVWARPFPRLRPRRQPVGQIEAFRHAGDAAKQWPNHVVRDAEYLNWRYIQAPRRYTAIAAAGSYAVLGHKEHRGTALAYISDLVGQPRELLRACLASVEPGVRALVAIPAPEHRRAYAALGFVPTRTTLHFIGKALAGKLETNRHAWRFTLGDTDFF